MKKFATFVLAVILCLSCLVFFTGCKIGTTNGSQSVSTSRQRLSDSTETSDEYVSDEASYEDGDATDDYVQDEYSDDTFYEEGDDNYLDESSDGGGYSNEPRQSDDGYDYGYNDQISEYDAQLIMDCIDIVRRAFEEGGYDCKRMSLNIFRIKEDESELTEFDESASGYCDVSAGRIILIRPHGGVSEDTIVHELIHYQTSAFCIWEQLIGSDFWEEVLTDLVTSKIYGGRESYPDCAALYGAIMDAIQSGGYDYGEVEDEILRYYLNSDRNGLASYINGFFGANVFNIRRDRLEEAATQLARAADNKGLDSSSLYYLSGSGSSSDENY